MLKRVAIAASAFVAVLALAGTASADTGLTLTVGPALIPSVPVQVCLTQSDVPGGVNNCVSTPPAQSVSLTVNVQVATPSPVIVPPAITPVSCPAGTQGIAAKVFSGSVNVTISGSVTVVLNNGTPVTTPISQVVAAGGQTLTIFACAGISPGVPVPSVPGLPGLPLPPVPGLPGLPLPALPVGV